MLGTRIKETLIHGATKQELMHLISQAQWLRNYTKRTEVTLCSTPINILPQAMAAHLLILFGEQAPPAARISLLAQDYAKYLNFLGDRWKDRLQASLFTIASHEIGTRLVLKAIHLAHSHEMALGVNPKNFKNWMFVQEFLFAIMQNTDKVRPINKTMYTIIEIMSMIADDFPDDLSPEQKLDV